MYGMAYTETGKVKHHVNALHQLDHPALVANIFGDQGDPIAEDPRQVFATPVSEVVHDNDSMVRAAKLAHDL
jgi:hypothetical protein